jgi:hypothetical protein
VKPLAGRNELLLYLDFDGVLHHENVLWHPRKGAWVGAPPPHRLFQHAGLLEEVLTPYPEVQIVLSTSWVRQYGFSGTAKKLPASIRGKVIGATFHSRMQKDEFLTMSRGMQVWADVYRRQPRDWLALDDDYLHWPAWCHDKYIRTHEQQGLSDPVVLDEFKMKLRRMCADEESGTGEKGAQT